MSAASVAAYLLLPIALGRLAWLHDLSHEMTQSPVVVSMGTLVGLALGSAALAALATLTLRTAFMEPQESTRSKHPSGKQKRQTPPCMGPCDPARPTTDPMVSFSEQKRSDPYDPSPRRGYLTWDDYFMALAFLSAQRSKDPNKQVGAVIVGEQKVVLGIGYNGFPRGCPDHALPWAKKPPPGSVDPLETKYPYVVHAEANALLNTNTAAISGATLYVTMFPCNECAKLLIQAGIRHVVYHEEKVASDSCVTSAAQLCGTLSPQNSAPDLDTTSAHHLHSDGQAQVHVLQPPHTHADPPSSQPTPAAVLVCAPGVVASGDERVQSASSDACYLASKKLLEMTGVTLRQHTGGHVAEGAAGEAVRRAMAFQNN